MSSFMCSRFHYNALLSWARSRRMSLHVGPHRRLECENDEQMQTAIELLQRANEHAVNVRYADDDLAPAYHFRFDARAADLPAIAIVKACDCADYQCAEFDEWEGSPAWRILQQIQARAIGCLPGYDAAPWELQPSGAGS